MRLLMLFPVVACATFAACASGGSSATPGVPDMPETVRIGGGGSAGVNISTVTSSSDNAVTVAVPIERVWRVLPQIYDSLKIPVNTLSASSHTIGNSEFKIRRKLGEVPLSHYIDCGNAQGPPSADTYEIELAVLTRLVSDGAGGTTISTSVESSGRPITLSGEFARCTSKGVLESQIANLVKTRG